MCAARCAAAPHGTHMLHCRTALLGHLAHTLPCLFASRSSCAPQPPCTGTAAVTHALTCSQYTQAHTYNHTHAAHRQHHVRGGATARVAGLCGTRRQAAVAGAPAGGGTEAVSSKNNALRARARWQAGSHGGSSAGAARQLCARWQAAMHAPAYSHVCAGMLLVCLQPRSWACPRLFAGLRCLCAIADAGRMSCHLVLASAQCCGFSRLAGAQRACTQMYTHVLTEHT